MVIYGRSKKANKILSLDWKKLYTFTEAYQADDLSPKSLYQVYFKILSDKYYFNQILKFNTLMKDNGPISNDLKGNFLCALISLKHSDMKNCLYKTQYSSLYFHRLKYTNL